MITIQAKSGPTQVSGIPVNRVDARAFLGGIPERTFFKLESEGIIVAAHRRSPGKPSVYDLATITPAYIAYLKTINGVGSERDARSRRDTSQAELNELRLAVQKKELLPRDQVVHEGRLAILATKAKLLAMPRRMVQAGHIPAEMQPAVAAMIRETLEEMSTWKTQTDLLAASGDGRKATAPRRSPTSTRPTRPLPLSP